MPEHLSESGSDRQVLQFERDLVHPVERVWEALIDPVQLGQWYPFAVHAFEPGVGGRIAFDDGEGTIYYGEIREFEPPHLLSFTEAQDLVHIKLRAGDRGCRMIFTHTFDDPSLTEGNEIGWRECLAELKRILDA